MSGRKRSRSASGSRATPVSDRPLPVRASARRHTVDRFNKHERWESLVTAGEQAGAEFVSDTSNTSPESPKRNNKGREQRSKLRKAPSKGHNRTSEKDADADNAASVEPLPKRRRLHKASGVTVQTGSVPGQAPCSHSDIEDEEYEEYVDASETLEGLNPQELQDIAQEQKQSRRQNTNRGYEYAAKKFLWYLEHHGEDDPLIDPGLKRDTPLDGTLIGKKGLALATRYLKWAGRNFPGYVGIRHAATLSFAVFSKTHAALQAMYAQQLMENDAAHKPEFNKLMRYPPYQAVYDSVSNRLADDHDPLDNTGQETFSTVQIQQLNRHMLSENQTDADRDHALNMWLYNVVGRSDDGRLVYQPDFLPPRQIKSIGPCPAMVLAAVVRGGKSQKNGKVGYLGCIRHKDPLRCAHAAMARWMIRRYTIDKASFPDPRQKTAWNKEVPCFPARHGAKENLSYEQQANSMRKHLKRLKIFIKKLTHAWRVAGSRAMDAAGVDDNVIARMGGWVYEAMYKSYLEFFKTAGLMGAAGWEGASTNEFRMFFAERFFIVVPEELEILVFPFLPELEKRVEALGANAGLSMKASILLFKYLAVVAVQDAAGGLALQYPEHDVHRLLNESPVFKKVMADHQHKLAAKEFEPYRPQLLADQVRDLKIMTFETMLHQRTGKIPSFLSHAKHFREAGSMTVEEEQRISHAAFEKILQMADAGLPPPEQALAETQLAGAPDGQGSEPSAPGASQPLPSAAVPDATTSATRVQPTVAAHAAACATNIGPAGPQPGAGVTHSPLHQVRAPGISAYSSVTMAPVAGVDPASAPLAKVLTSPPLPTAPPAMHASMGGHAMVYVAGYGLVPSVPAVAPGWGFSTSAGMPMYGVQPAYSGTAPVQVHNPTPTLPHMATSAGAVHLAASMHQACSIGAGSTVPATAAAAAAAPSQPRIVRAFPQLSTFKSLEHLYQVVTKGDSMTGTLSFDAMTRADPEWRKGLSKRYFEIDSAVKEMTERAAAEQRQTGQQVSPMKYAKLMDAERAEHGKGKSKGAPTPVATWVKNVLGPIRAQRNKQLAE
ncbi:hypothetical protein ABBQ38_15496 [Trebouxia sp. C0009 RCD-2024]